MFFNKFKSQEYLITKQRLQDIDQWNLKTQVLSFFFTDVLNRLYRLGSEQEWERGILERQSIRSSEILQWVGQDVIAITNDVLPVIGKVIGLETFGSESKNQEPFLIVEDVISGKKLIPFTRKVYALNYHTYEMMTNFPGDVTWKILNNQPIIENDKEIISVRSKRMEKINLAMNKAGYVKTMK